MPRQYPLAPRADLIWISFLTSRGFARVVPGYSGTDWAAEIDNRDVRMKADHVKTRATTEEVSSHPGEKGHWSQKWHRNTPYAGEKPRGGLEKGFANLLQGKKITKKAHAGRGHETKWEIPIKTFPNNSIQPT
jgi:hypothetical protein